MRRTLDWAGWAGLAVLVAAIALPFVRPGLERLRWALLAAGVVLVLISLAVHVGDLRGVLGRRTARYGLNAAVMVLVVVGILGLVEAVSYRHNARFDITENRRHSLALQTIELLRGLKTDVTAVAFFRGDQPGKRLAEDLFEQYARHGGGRFTWKVVDPDREPALARRYGIETYGTIVLETPTKSEKVLDVAEEKLTNGLLRVTREGKRVVYVVQGHGEHDLGDTDRQGFSEAKAAMERANYEVKPLTLARAGAIPEDAAVVILPGPRTELLAPELKALDDYVERGGKLFLMVNPTILGTVKDAGIRGRLTQYGIEVRDDLVVESNPIGQLFGIGPEVPIVTQYDPHPITRDLAGISTLFPLTRSIATAAPPPQGVTAQPLAKTSQESWGETDQASLRAGQVAPGPGDTRGPLNVAAVATKGKARIVVYGTSSGANNQFLNMQGNRDLFLNTVSWLAEEEDQITIRPKETRQTPVFLSGRQAQALFLLPVVVLPGVVLVAGVVAVVRHRSSK